MRHLGNIRLYIRNEGYSVQFKHSTPRKIDFFELTLMEIIKHAGNFHGQTIEDVLMKMEIPESFHEFFESIMLKFIKEPIMIELKNVDKDSEDDDYDDDDYEDDEILSQNVSNFLLTKIGEEAYFSQEIPEDPKHFSEIYCYDPISKRLNKTTEYTANKHSSVVVNIPELDDSDNDDIFDEIISKNPDKFIPKANAKTKIFDLESYHYCSYGKSDNIAVSINGGKISFSHNNSVILKAFLEADAEEKQQLREKEIFNYLNIPQTRVNYETAKIAVKRRQPIKMKIAFGETEAIESITETKFPFQIDTDDLNELRAAHDFCFAGITVDNKPLIYNYCKINEEGYEIPLEEEDYSSHSYGSVFNIFLEKYISQHEAVIMAAPQEQKSSVIKRIMQKKFSEKNFSVENTIEILKQYDLPKDQIIKIFLDNVPRTDEIINKMLELDETATIRIYDLKKLYNLHLKTEKLSEIQHNTNLYASFADYEKQYKKLRTIGVKNYYNYGIPENWDAFMKEVYILRSKFVQIKPHLEESLTKQIEDFLERIEDDYDNSVQFNENTIKQYSDKKLKKAVYNPQSDVSLIAYIVRRKYEKYLRMAEKNKDPKSDEKRKGKVLIQFSVKSKLVNETYRHWRNLCTLVHKDTENPLWNGKDENRRKLLISALFFYNKQLAPKEEKDESLDTGTV